MRIGFSYGGFTTHGHGVIEYTDPHPVEGGRRKVKRHKSDPKLTTRWPRADPIRVAKPNLSKTKDISMNAIIDKKCLKMFKKRFPGQTPQKGQIKALRQEAIKALGLENSVSIKARQLVAIKTKQPQKHKPPHMHKPSSSGSDVINELALKKYSKLYPGEKPSGDRFDKIRQEIIAGRKQLGL